MLIPELSFFVLNIQAASVVLVATVALLLFQRLVFHPLARFPGPILAASTWWYMTYYEVFRDGALVSQLEKLHAIYGPVVRIGPNQLHFATFKAYNDIYTNGHRFTKDPRTYRVLQQDDSSLSLVDPRKVKVRRDVMGPAFSRRAILRLEYVVRSKVEALVAQMIHYGEAAQPVNIRRAYRSTALEIIYAYCFGSNEDYISAPDFSHKFVLDQETTGPMFNTVVHFPWLFDVLVFTTRVISWIRPKHGVLRDSYNKLEGKIDELLAHPELLDKEEHETVFHHLLLPHPDKGQPQALSKKELWEESISLIAGGSETVSIVLSVGTFYVLNDHSIHETLVAELREAWPDLETSPRLETLEKLPYLTAVIRESLRVAHGVVHPLPRVVGHTEATIGGFNVPTGAIVSMSATFVHNDPNIFPDPHVFRPERWLNATKDLDQHLVPFLRGPRMCVGLNLAWSEMYLLAGYIFRKLYMKLHDTKIEDMAYRCHLTPTFRGKPLHCVVKARVE